MADQELRDICNRIYQKYKTAIDLIVNNSDMDSAKGQMLSGIKTALKEYADEGKIKYSDGVIFYTKEMDEIIPDMDSPISSWGNTKIYQNWFEVWDKRITIHFEIAGKNLSEEQDKLVDCLMDLTKPHTKSKPFVWKRLINLKRDFPDTENNVAENAYKIAKDLLDELLAREKTIYEKLKKKA